MVNAIPGLAKSVRLPPGIYVHLHPGIAFGIIQELRSPSPRNPVHLRPEYARASQADAFANGDTIAARSPVLTTFTRDKPGSSASEEELASFFEVTTDRERELSPPFAQRIPEQEVAFLFSSDSSCRYFFNVLVFPKMLFLKLLASSTPERLAHFKKST
jgi:hypothetical protein